MESKHEFIQLSISNYNRHMPTKTFHKKLTCAAAHIVHTLIRLGYVTKDELLEYHTSTHNNFCVVISPLSNLPLPVCASIHFTQGA